MFKEEVSVDGGHVKSLTVNLRPLSTCQCSFFELQYDAKVTLMIVILFLAMAIVLQQP